MTIRGPKPIPTYLKVLRGNTGKRPINQHEPQPEQFAEVPDPPEFLSGYEVDEWKHTAPELHRLKLLTTIDVPAFAAFCSAFGQWRMAAESLHRMQSGDPVMNGMIIKAKNGDAMTNPLVSIVRKHAGDVVRYAAEFGMTPAARARIAMGPDAQEDFGKFNGLIAS